MKKSVIVYAKRTAVGKMNGALSSVDAPLLGAALVKDALTTTGINPGVVDEIIMGQVLTAGVGQAPARQTALYGGLPYSTCATTIGRVCGSGIKSVMLADQAIRLGDSEVVFAGGQENMSAAPHVMPGSRNGYRFGNFEVKDSMQFDGLWDPYSNAPMGNFAELCAEKYEFSREAQDEFALASYTKARKASESGVFADEIVPVAVTVRRKETIVELDEEPFSVDLDKIPKLRPAFKKDGTVTAANASSINDGAAMVLMMSEEKAKELGLKPIASVVATASYAHDPSLFTTAPVNCMKKLFEKSGMTKDDIDLFEINEAFAVVTMAAEKELDLDSSKVNVHGGAVSLGHPIGCSGTRVLVTLLNALQKTGGKTGLATLCIGGGEASGVIVEMM